VWKPAFPYVKRQVGTHDLLLTRTEFKDTSKDTGGGSIREAPTTEVFLEVLVEWSRWFLMPNLQKQNAKRYTY
jgi:hypothetical protein